ncbi:MAG TPA: pilus assembly protein TadG-related protein [Stellaceae bacterium]|nr:pilus assembly protein TadG-related protein [Stellaceae bacterium]
MRNLCTDDRGVSAIITALSVTAVMGVAALGTDAAMWEVNKRSMQSAADQAAVAAVVAYLAGGGSDPAATAQGVAANFGFANGNNGVIVTPASVSPSPTGYDAAYSVTISQPQPQYFSALILSAPTISATATAGTTSNGPCILSLNPTANSAFSDTGGSAVSLTDCDLDVNSNGTTGTVVSGGGGSVSAQNINLNGGDSVTGGATLAATNRLTTNTGQTYPDPYQHRTAPTVGSCATNGAGYNGNFNSGGTLYPGTYCGSLSIGGSTAFTLKPGVYVFTDQNGYGSGSAPQVKVNNGTLCADGVTIYVKSAGNAQVQFSGNSTNVYLIAPAPGTSGLNGETEGLAIWVDKVAPTNASVSFTGGSTQIIGGAVYAPNNTVTFSGGSSNTSITQCPVSTNPCVGTTQILSDKVSISGGSTLTHSSSNNSCVGDSASSARVKLIQ